MVNSARPLIGRPPNAKNKHTYRYEVILDDSKKLCQSQQEVAEYLSVTKDTVARKLRKPDAILRKYKNKHLEINRVNLPVFTIAIY